MGYFLLYWCISERVGLYNSIGLGIYYAQTNKIQYNMNILSNKNLELARTGFQDGSGRHTAKEVNEVLTFLADDQYDLDAEFPVALGVRHSDGKSEDWFKSYYFTKEQMLKLEFPHLPTWATYAVSPGSAIVAAHGQAVAAIVRELMS